MSKYSMKKETYIDEKSKIILSKYDFVGAFNEKIAPVRKNNLWGYIDEDGNEIFSTDFDKVYDFKDGIGKVSKKNDNNITYYGLVDRFGVVAPLIYEEIGIFSNGLARVKRNGKYGFIDACGSEVIKPKYDKASNFIDGKAVVRTSNDSMVLNTDGKVLVRYNNADIDEFKNNVYSVVRKGSKEGIIDKNCKEVLPLQRKYGIFPFVNNLTILYGNNFSNHKLYIWDGEIKNKIPSYDNISIVSENNLLITDYDSVCPYYLTDLNGNKLSKGYDLIEKRCDNIYRVYNHKYGLINSFGEEITDLKYDYIGDYNNNVFKVKKDGKWGLINILGEEITDVKYDMITDFNKNGLAEAKLGSKRGFLNNKGEVVAYYDKMCAKDDDIVSKTIINDRYMLYERVASPKYAIYDIKNKILTDYSFNLVSIGDNVVVFDNNYIVKKDNFDFKYRLILKNNEKEVFKDFDTIKQRDKYCSLAIKEIKKADKEYERRISSVSKEIEKIIYSDLDKQIDSKYKLNK